MTQTSVSRTARRVMPALGAALALTAATMTGAESTAPEGRPQPGEYEITIATTYTDVPLPDSTLTTATCLAETDMDEDPASILAALPDGAECSVVEFVMAHGEVSMRVICDAGQSSMVVVTSGSYATDRWDLDSDVTVRVGTDEVKMHSTIASRRTGDC